ncbi:hypothetical protein MY10362_008041 [Beauveria mimosiformis]
MDMAIGLMSLAAVALLTRQCLRVKSRAGQSRQLYRDEDGVATQGLEVEARKSASVKLFLNAAAAMGASMSILDVRRSSNTGQWSLPAAAVSRVGIWLLLAAQALTIANEVGIRQYLLQRLLGSLERPFAQQQYTMGYALSLGLALLLENMSAGWTTWVTQAKLTTPMTALLKGSLFENMTRRRSSQQAAPQAAKRKDVLSLGSLMSNDW